MLRRPRDSTEDLRVSHGSAAGRHFAGGPIRSCDELEGSQSPPLRGQLTVAA